jgi:perosamine synthetase
MQVRAQAYDFSPEDIEAITTQLRELLETRSFLTLGSHVAQFEAAFADRHGARFGCATNSGTAALEAILRALEVDGGEVILPTNTFAATAFAVLRAGARPVFADIGTDMTLDPDDTVARVTSATRAAITVHIGGLVSRATDALVEACDDRSIPLVEDAAHAHGSALDGRPAGTFGVAGAFSFFSTKVMTTGEGGMVVSSDPRIDEVARLLRDQAKVAGGNHHEAVGHNWRMTEVQAILGMRQLARLDEFIARRQKIAARYDEVLTDITGLEPLEVPDGAEHNFYKYIAFVRDQQPEDLRRRLAERHSVSLGGYVYDTPLHEQPVFRDFREGRLPVAEELCRSHICPPIYPSLTDEQIDHVAAALRTEVAAATTDARSD